MIDIEFILDEIDVEDLNDNGFALGAAEERTAIRDGIIEYFNNIQSFRRTFEKVNDLLEALDLQPMDDLEWDD